MPSEPAYVTAFKAFIKRGVEEDHFADMTAEFHGQNDRTTIILAASIVDESITDSIRALLRDHGVVRSLFDPDGPLGSFASRISLGFGLRLFDTKTKHDLDLIRLLRNGCAHSQIPFRFEMTEIRDVCAHLVLPDLPEFGEVPEDYEQAFPEISSDMSHPKTRFVSATSTIWTPLSRFAYKINLKPGQSPSLPLLP